MDAHDTITPGTLHNRRRMVYPLAIALFAVIAAFGYLLLPDHTVSAQLSASGADIEGEAPVTATRAMIDLAVNLRSASGFTAYAGKGIIEDGAEVKGPRGDARRSAAGRKAASELESSIDALRQLPCTELKSSALAGRTFTPGVYCLNSAELDGEMALDGQGSAEGIFIFRVAGTLNAKGGSSIRTENGAQSANVFFVAAEAEIGPDAAFRASVLSSGGVRIESGAVVTEKVLALGKAELQGGSLLGGSTGTMRICSEQPLPVAPPNDLSNRIFHYVVTGATGIGTAANPVRVAVGTCSEPFDVTAGPQTVAELNTGGLVSPPSGTFEGNFELIDVADLTPSSPSSLGLVNLASRTASVNIVAGDPVDQLSLRFTNRHAITGFIEICTRAATGPAQHNPGAGNSLEGGDPDVSGYFEYTISGVYSVNQQNPNVKTLQIFTVPRGQCTGPLAVTKGDPAPFGSPASTVAKVSMLPRVGVFLESVDVAPADRRNGPDIKGMIVGVDPLGNEQAIPAPGGGHVEVLYRASATPVDETLLVVRVRSNPGRLKICKVAGPGIPINTLFRFTVTGTGALNAAHPQSAQFGPVTRTMDVRAGDPAQGGSCDFVPGIGSNSPAYNQFQTFVNGTPVGIVENGISPNNQVEQTPGQLRVSQVRLFGSTFAGPAKSGYNPNPDITPTPDRVARASVFARFAIAEVEFSGFRFNPATLKVCGVGLDPATVGREFQYTVSLISPEIGGANPGPMFPAFTTSVTVTAAPPGGSGEGNCSFVNGSGLLGGAFNQGSTIRVTQAANGNSRVNSITCPSCGPGGLTSDLVQRRATLSGPQGVVAGINAVIFTNTAVVPPGCGEAVRGSGARQETSCRPTRFDFDGDLKADPSVFSPTEGKFAYAASANSYQIVSRNYGVAGDLPVPADYDGDGRNDVAVWRPSNGMWYVQTSTVFFVAQWGQTGDIPQVGDYDGDGRSDFMIFRPSNGTWYVKTRSDSFHIFPFGVSTDKPYARDYDADGRTDAAVFRSGVWYILGSNSGFTVRPFGQAGDTPVPADYDGNGGADLAVFRGGTWYILNSIGYSVRSHGMATDLPVPADFDGDGKADLAAWRPSEGRWYIKRSAFSEAEFVPPIILGQPTDIPLPWPNALFAP